MIYSRHLNIPIRAALADTPVVAIVGPRQCGKSTLARELMGAEWPATYLTLDDLPVLAAAQNDPAGFIAGYPGPLILDEIQRVPDLLLAIKAEVDRRRRPGRFLLTGSANVLMLPRLADALTGRMEIRTLWPLSAGEIAGKAENFVDWLFGDAPPRATGADAALSPGDMDRILLAGGFPEALARRTPERRKAWFEAYIGALMQRDLRDLANIEKVSDLPHLLHAAAGRAGGLINYADMARSTNLNQVTLKRYFVLMQAVFLVLTLPAWRSRRLRGLAKAEKLYFADTGLLAHVRGATLAGLASEPKSRGPLFENFVAGELLKHIGWSETRPSLFHYRSHSGGEVDFILEGPGQHRMVAVEAKAGATVRADDFKWLKRLQEEMGAQFHRGVVLYTGAQAVPFGERLWAIPVANLWRGAGTAMAPGRSRPRRPRSGDSRRS